MSKPLWVNLLWGRCEPELNSGCSVHVLQQKMLKPTPVSTARWIFGVPASIIALCHHSILHNWHGLWHSFVRRGQQNLQQICVTRAACLGTNPWWTTETGKSKSAWAMSLFKHPSVVSLSTPAIFNVNTFFLIIRASLRTQSFLQIRFRVVSTTVCDVAFFPFWFNFAVFSLFPKRCRMNSAVPVPLWNTCWLLTCYWTKRLMDHKFGFAEGVW